MDKIRKIQGFIKKCFPELGMFALTAVFLLAFLPLSAQDSNKIISIDVKDATVKEFLTRVEAQSDYSFVYKDADIDAAQRVTLRATGTVEQLVKRALPNFSLRIENRMIILTRTAVKSAEAGGGNGKLRQIKGVVASTGGEALVGATILVKGNNALGTVTGDGGRFTLLVPPGATLVASFIGYQSEEVPVGSRTNVEIRMAEDTKAIDEVVVMGYGSQRKVTLTGSVATTSGEALVKSSSVNLSQGLAGRISGVIVNNRSGEPGKDDAVMYIRGRSTLGDNSPLIIIDGIAGRGDEFSRLSGDEIESVTVLKDASAAIYGSRSANGVILVTTKRGQINTAPRITFNYDLGLQQPTRLVEMADAVLYTESYNASRAIDGASAMYSPEQIQKYRDGSDPISYPNTDWMDTIIKSLSAQHKYGVSVSGGTNKLGYFVQLNGQYQDGIYEKSATKYKQYSVRSNLDVQVTKSLKVGFDLAAREQHKDYSAFPSDNYGIFYIATHMKPTGGAYYPNGMLRGGTNPAVLVQDLTGYDKTKINTLNTTFTADWDLGWLTKGLSVKGNLAYDVVSNFRKNWQRPWQYFSYDEVNEVYEEHTSSYWPTATLREYQTRTSNLTVNAAINYNREFNGHNVSAMVGFEQNQFRKDYMSASRLKYGSDALDELFAGDADKNYYDNDGNAAETARRSYFGRFSYDYRGKYLVQAIMRYDGSENFPKDNRWGFFPGVSAGWRISEEPFVKDNLTWLSNLKLRASYGEQGNDQINAFQYVTTYAYSNSTVYKAKYDNKDVNFIIPGTTPNPFVTWEVAKTWNVGLDGEIRGGLLSWELEYFHTRRENILCTRNASIPNYSGLTNLPDENIGIVQNSGLEFQLAHQGRSADGNFRYRLAGNFMYAKNKVVYMDEAPWPEGHDYMKLEGHPMGSGLYYQVIGINKTDDDLMKYPQMAGASLGDFIYADLDGDGEITNLDRKRCDLTAVPQIVFGLNFSATYKNWDFMALFQGQARARYYYAPLKDHVSSNVEKEAARKAWTLDNRDSDYPRMGSIVSNAGVNRSSFYYKNAAFLRLKNLEIGYTFPERFFGKSGIKGLRLYVGGYNLFTIDGLKTVDPETSDEELQTYPQMRIYNAGVKIMF